MKRFVLFLLIGLLAYSPCAIADTIMDHGVDTPLLTDQVWGIDDPGGTPDDSRFTLQAIADLFWTDLAAGDIPDISATYQPLLTNPIVAADVDDTPVNGETAVPVSSNWAYDHGAAADPHTGYQLESGMSAYQADLAVPSQAEAEAGVATTERVWTAERVAQAIAAQAGGGTDDQRWDEIGNPTANDEIDLGAYVIELNTEDFRIGDGGANYFRVYDDSGTIKVSFNGNAVMDSSTMTMTDTAISHQTGVLDADYFSFAAYDVNGTAYVSLLRPVASDTPHLEVGPATNFMKFNQDGSITLEGSAAIEGVDATELALLDGLTTLSGSNTGDDDVPDAGDFGAATDLDANGALVANAVDNAAMADNAIGNAEMADDAIGMNEIDDDGDFTSLTGDWATTGYVSGQANVQTDASGAITLTVNAVNYGTDTGDADIPDGACDAAGDVGNWVVLISSAADAYSLTSNDASNQFIIAANAAALTAGNELDVDGTMVSVMCIAAELWKVTGYMGDIPTDGGVAD